MQFSVLALAAFAASAAAHYNGTVTYTTQVVTNYVTVCPSATTITHGGVTYTAKPSETLTITGPVTIVKPVTTSSVVICKSCPATSAPVYTNATTAYPTTTKASVGTTLIPSSTPSTTPIVANSGSKAFAFSGASLVGLVGIAAVFL